MKGIWFDNLHSYSDLNLILSKAEIPPAVAKTNYIDIPGGDGSIDATEAHGEVKYKDRQCKFTLSVLPSDDFEEKKREVSNLLNGMRCKIVLDKDPDWYWEGRCSVDSYASNKNMHQIVIGAVVKPYKLRIKETSVVYPAHFHNFKTLYNERKKVVPTITTTAKASFSFNGNVYSVDAGTHTILDIQLLQGENRLLISSTGEATVTYREGAL